MINNKDADTVVSKSFLACKPLIEYLSKWKNYLYSSFWFWCGAMLG
jgi:hypothetical protein